MDFPKFPPEFSSEARATVIATEVKASRSVQDSLDLLKSPDHKTIKRILDGLPVQDGTVDKLLAALNKIDKWGKLRPEHVPSD